MTGNSLLSKIRTKLILALIIVGLLCTSLFVLSACSQNESSDIPSYSYTDTDDGLISNPNFSYNTSTIKLENFPQTSPSGWSRSKDSDGNSSSAKSGVIDISEDGWKAFLNSIYSDSYYLDYLENKLGFNKSDIEKVAKEENPDITSDELKAKVVEQFSSKLTAPAKNANSNDNKVYMLNNYTSKIGIGASQKITASKSITVEKGQFVQITVDVLTQNLSTTDKDGASATLGLTGANDEFGASIRLTNSLNSNSQAEYAITNINTNNAWKTYTLFVKGDAEFDCTVTLALGLGYSDLYPTEGTVYFDNVTVTELENQPSSLPTATTLTYGETKAKTVNADNTLADGQSFYYDMTLSIDGSYYKAISPAISGDYTEGFTNKGFSNYTASFSGDTVAVKNASYSLKIESASDFKVSREQYAYVSFKLDNQLSKFGSTTITVDVYEGTDKKAAVATVTETGETTVGLMIKNNFDKDDTTSGFLNERSFYIVIVVGPTSITSSDKLSDYASGTVKISDFKIAKGATYQYEDDDKETANYTYYKLFNSVADGSTSLYSGYNSDFTASTDSSTASTGFSVATTYNEYLNKQLVAASDYDGIESDHIYLSNEATNSKINTRLTGKDGSFAGVIDTKYSNDASYNKPANLPDLDENIRALMIYNKAQDAYGFVSNKDAQVISANSFAKITVSVMVDATASAYIYLVDTSTKKPLIFDSFTPNSNGITSIQGQEKASEEFKFVVTNTNEEWVDVTFYIATGKTEKSFRVELWNGSRDGANKSTGYVFFKSVNVSLSNAFSEPTSYKDSFTTETSPLYGQESAFDSDKIFCYSRPLTETEKEFNKDYPDSAISYSPKIVWASNDKTIYAVLNNLDVEETNPYDTIVEEDSSNESAGCAAETDPATFWLSFSSILLVVVLILAIAALIIKRVRRSRKAHASDAKSHYTVKSRVRTAPKAKKAVQKKEEEIEETQDVEEIEEPVEEEIVEEVVETEEEVKEEQTLDEYVYGDVQDFGNDENKEKESE